MSDRRPPGFVHEVLSDVVFRLSILTVGLALVLGSGAAVLRIGFGMGFGAAFGVMAMCIGALALLLTLMSVLRG